MVESEEDSHCLGLQERKVSVLETPDNNQEEVCWGRKANEAGKHETHAATVVVVPGKTAASDGVEPAEPGAAGKHPMTRLEVVQESLLSVPYSAQVDVDMVTLRNNDTAAGYPFSRFACLQCSDCL